MLDALTLSGLLRLLANLSAHLAAWREDIATLIPDPNARTIINLDWEKWHAPIPPHTHTPPPPTHTTTHTHTPTRSIPRQLAGLVLRACSLNGRWPAWGNTLPEKKAMCGVNGSCVSNPIHDCKYCKYFIHVSSPLLTSS